MARIVAIGMSNTDLVCDTPKLPRAGETVAGTSFATYAGGKGANQAVAAARAGATVSFIGAVGDDAYGEGRLADLEQEGIDTTGVQVLKGIGSGIALIVVDTAGENQIVTVAGANALVDADIAAAALARSDVDLVMMTWELEPATSAALIKAVGPDVPILLNIAPYHESVRDVLRDDRIVVIANEVEAGQLLGRDVNEYNAIYAVEDILAMRCRAVVITLGANGAVGHDWDRGMAVGSPDVDVVDTTGAGDAFCGVFAAWLASGETFVSSVIAGVHAGALATTRHGAQPSIPYREAIEWSLWPR